MNQHYDAAGSLLHSTIIPGDSPEGVVAMLEANTEATLALAYEQRTANLIAFERAQWDAWRQDELNPEGVELWRRAAEQVNERLGLG